MHISIDSGKVAPLAANDDRLPGFLDKCRDFFLQHGHPPAQGADGLVSLVRDVSPEQQLRDVLVLGVNDRANRLVGLVMLIRDWQVRGNWCLRLMLIDPERRGRGVGSDVYRQTVHWARRQGAKTVGVGVLVANAGALRFWRRLGFVEARSQLIPGLGIALDLEQQIARPGA